LGFQIIESVETTFVAVVVTTVAQAVEAMEEVPRADVPLAMVVVRPPAADRLLPMAVTTPVPVVVVADA